MDNELIESVVAHMEPADEVQRIIIRAAVIAAMDVCHETGDPETYRTFVIETVVSAFGRYFGIG